MQVRFTDDARSDLFALRDWLQPRSPKGYQRVIGAVFATISQLESYPLLGKIGRVDNTREIIVPRTSLFIVYSLPDAVTVDIDRIFDARMQYPEN